MKSAKRRVRSCNFNTGGQIVPSSAKIESWSTAMPKESSAPITEGLDAPSTQFREFAAECMELARKSPSLEQRMVYLKMACVWHQTTLRWEKGFHGRELAQCRGEARARGETVAKEFVATSLSEGVG
jgi:hypothetical protein